MLKQAINRFKMPKREYYVANNILEKENIL